jgi:Kef-type K+ transport system membrane component KefB
MEDYLETLKHLPLMARFAILMLTILVIPPLCERIRLPGVVGLLACGILLGPNGLDVAAHTGAGHDLAEIGKLLLMFFAGMEIDLVQFNRTRHRSLSFGAFTFALPLVAGIAAGLTFGYGWVSALLIGSLLASHTLLGFPVVQKLGLVKNEAVAVTIGATIFTDIASLLVLAVCIPIHVSGFAAGPFITQIVELAVFIPLVLLGLGKLREVLMARTRSKESQFGILLLMVALAAIGAEVIHLEGIIGAFLAGLAVNRAARGTHAKEELEFIGNNFFIPLFFIGIGFVIDLNVFFRTAVDNFWFMSSIVGGLILSKWLAARLAAQCFGYSSTEANLMWSLSLPQVAATLAAALVAYGAKNSQGQRLIDEPVLNTIIVLMVVSSILGPVLTDLFGRRIAPVQAPPPERADIILTPSRAAALVGNAAKG